MTRLSQSVDRAAALLQNADLAADATVRELLEVTTQRRSMDLSDLPPAEQAALIATRSQELQPSVDALAERIISADKKGRRFIAKFGIDPTGHLKKVLAGEITAAIHGVDTAMKAREEFVARFSKRTFGEVEDLSTVADLTQPVTEVVKALGFAKNNGDVLRVAQQNGLRLVVESQGNQEQMTLNADEAREPLDAVVKNKLDGQTGDVNLKVGRKLARITPAS